MHDSTTFFEVRFSVQWSSWHVTSGNPQPWIFIFLYTNNPTYTNMQACNSCIHTHVCVHIQSGRYCWSRPLCTRQHIMAFILSACVCVCALISFVYEVITGVCGCVSSYFIISSLYLFPSFTIPFEEVVGAMDTTHCQGCLADCRFSMGKIVGRKAPLTLYLFPYQNWSGHLFKHFASGSLQCIGSHCYFASFYECHRQQRS